jgi:alpha-tubulin suppressor-like RCC1 family protein
MRTGAIVLLAISAGCFPPPHLKDVVDAVGNDLPDSEDDSATSACRADGAICECTFDDDCADLDLCNGTEHCVEGRCVTGTPIHCEPPSDPNACAALACDPVTGTCVDRPLPDDRPCDDGLACTLGDHCAAGVCSGTARVCNDDLACSVDHCSEERGGCIADMARCQCLGSGDCQDANLCDGIERCEANACVAGTPVACAPSENPCKEAYCDGATGECESRNKAGTCDDTDPCTIDDACVAGTCVGTRKVCAASDACHRAGSCDPLTGACSDPAADDGLACVSSAHFDGICAAGACEPYPVLSSNYHHVCALQRSGDGTSARVKCWGLGSSGALGRGNEDDLGDRASSMVVDSADVEVGFVAATINAGGFRTCATSTVGAAKCWGGSALPVGVGDKVLVPPGSPIALGDGVEAAHIASGPHTCVVTTDGDLKCWGDGTTGALGYGDAKSVGDIHDVLPASLGFVSIRDTIASVAIGTGTTCALNLGGQLRCWGTNADGQLGYGDRAERGSTPATVPSQLPFVSVSDDPTAIVTKVVSTLFGFCALTSTHEVRCWGNGDFGRLGRGLAGDLGDDELPSSVPAIDLGVVGGVAIDVQGGQYHTCALSQVGASRLVKCFGGNQSGQLGLGNKTDMAATLPKDLPAVNLGGDVESIVVGNKFACAVMRNAKIRCWGDNTNGRLGIGSTQAIGDYTGEMPPADTVVFGP